MPSCWRGVVAEILACSTTLGAPVDPKTPRGQHPTHLNAWEQHDCQGMVCLNREKWGWHLVDVELSHIPQGRSGNDSSPATLARGWEKGERQTLKASLKCLGSPPRQSLHSCKSKPSSALVKGLDPTSSSCARGVKTSTRHSWHFPGLSAQGGKPRLPPSRSGNLPKAAANECFWSVTRLLSAAEPSGVFAQEQLLTLTAELGAPSWPFFSTLPARFHLLRSENYEKNAMCFLLGFFLLRRRGNRSHNCLSLEKSVQSEDTNAGRNSEPWELTSTENPGESIPERHGCKFPWH